MEFGIIHKKYKFIGACALAFIFLSPYAICHIPYSGIAYAADATLFLSPVAGTAIVGEEFPVRVYLSTPESVNAIEGDLHFDPELIEVRTISTDGSGISSWTVTPTFDNASGTIKWGGIVPAGIAGERIPVLMLYLTLRRAAEAPLRFSSGAAVFAANGSGTNLLTAMNGGMYVGVPKESVPVTPEVADGASPASSESVSGEVLGASTGTDVIMSDTHQDPDKWYKEKTAVFSWSLDASVIAVRTGFDHLPRANPLREYIPPIKEKKVADIEDGVWYFHLARDTADGGSGVSHRRVQIDSAPPAEFSIALLSSDDKTNPRPAFAVTASDTLSGIEKFTLALDDSTPVPWNDDGTHRYEPGAVSPGDHVLHGVAYDRAGNPKATDLSFAIDALPPPDMGVSDNHPKEGARVTFTGKTIPDATVRISLARAGDTPVTEETRSTPEGTFSHESALALVPGAYDYWAEVTDARGAKSKESAHFQVTVSSTAMGVIKRHPMVLVAGGALLSLLGALWFIMRRFMRRKEFPVSATPPSSSATALRATKTPEQHKLFIASESAPVPVHEKPAVSCSGGVVRLGAYK